MDKILDIQSPVKILVVEDDHFTQKLLSSMFTSMNRQVVFASNGREGIEKFREHSPDMVISDYNMPEMNGLEMFSVMRAEKPGVKLVLMTIYTESDVLINAINMHVNRFLEKPVNLKNLKNVLHDLDRDIKTAKELVIYQSLLKAYREGVDSSTIFALLDSEGRYTYLNSNFCDISGYEENELIGKHYTKIRKDVSSDLKNFLQTSGDAGTSRFNSVVQCVSKSGGIYYTEAVLLNVKNSGVLTGFISIEKDMSEVVKYYKKNLQMFFDADSSIMMAFSKKNKLKICNQAGLDFFGYKSVKSMNSDNFCIADSIIPVSGYCSEEIPEGMNCREKTGCFINGVDRSKIKKIALSNASGDTEHFFTVNTFDLDQSYLGLDVLKIIRLNDISELEQLRRDEMQSAALASIGKLAAGITHEINTPLTYIKGNFELLNMELESALTGESLTEVADYFNSIDDGISRISSIIESMREITGGSGVEKENINVYSTIVYAGRMIFNRSKHIANIYINGRLLDMDTDPSAEKIICTASAKLLEQVWIILLNNSLDQLAVSKLSFADKYIKINIVISETGKIKITIEDNGGGIDKAILHKLFELFSSTKKHSGMGIGLNIAKTIIEKHSGSIKAYNKDGCAVFEVLI